MSSFSHLLPHTFKEEVHKWIHDDMPSFDIGGFVVGDKIETAKLLCKSPAVFSGLPFAQAAFDILKCNVEWLVEEGTYLNPSDGPIVVAIVTGPCRNILMAERTVLNTISRASGVAKQAYLANEISKSCQWHGYVSGTRKTTPGFRIVEKYSLIVGGIATHRLSLSQMVMLKDNHIWSAGNITNAVKLARKAAGFSMKIEVECQSVEEAKEAALAGADIVMLDNFTGERLKEGAAELKSLYPTLLIEASGVRERERERE
mmetsp:Transcript_26345/g.26589  ORF Transcript_26345/g.26589 Transcript_26345/m.26589 type:complete len:259 (+) Transcript_26345:82-858(+)